VPHQLSLSIPASTRPTPHGEGDPPRSIFSVTGRRPTAARSPQSHQLPPVILRAPPSCLDPPCASTWRRGKIYRSQRHRHHPAPTSPLGGTARASSHRGRRRPQLLHPSSRLPHFPLQLWEEISTPLGSFSRYHMQMV
jgi:hypothetical protein